MKLDLGKKNILDDFFDLLDEKRKEANKEVSWLEFYEKILNEFDIAYEKYINANSLIANAIMEEWLEKSLRVFYVIFKFSSIQEKQILNAFQRFINWFTLIFQECSNINEKNRFFFIRNFSENFPYLIVKF